MHYLTQLLEWLEESKQNDLLNFFFFFDRTQELVFMQEEEQYRSEYKLQTRGEKPEGKATAEQQLQPRGQQAHKPYNVEDDAGTRRRHPSPTEQRNS
jgi:hypothetical protein